MATFCPPLSMDNLSILVLTSAVFASSDERRMSLKKMRGWCWLCGARAKATSWPWRFVSKRIDRNISSSALEKPHFKLMAFNLPFQSREELRERARTTCAQSFRCLSDEQNMVADTSFDGSLMQQESELGYTLFES